MHKIANCHGNKNCTCDNGVSDLTTAGYITSDNRKICKDLKQSPDCAMLHCVSQTAALTTRPSSLFRSDSVMLIRHALKCLTLHASSENIYIRLVHP